ncbi:MAG: 4a-hydroxytetrahydrobiopterin dehydratase [Gammaproteobacteria bacterium]|nr:4a-hydroxytetrahydrobiopterin dehydratase [Gammaproteobacteria bacterium]
MTEKLTDPALAQALLKLNEDLDVPWSIVDGALHKQFAFDNFVQTFGFITQVALVAQRLNHHPDWSNRYKVVEFHLSTHKCHGISELDFQLAQQIESLAGQ